MPHAAASSATSPKLSLRLGTMHDVGGPVVGGEDVVRLRRDEAHLVGDAELVDQRAAAGRPRRRRRRRWPRRRSAAARRGGAAAARARTATSGPFSGWMRPTNSSTGDVARQAERVAGAAPVAGGEEGVLDAGGDDLDAPGRVAVQPAELALLLGAADADRVGAADDLGLGALAPQRLEVAALGLDPGQRVERGDERQVELVLEAVADDAR